jgi:hypothetical protein
MHVLHMLVCIAQIATTMICIGYRSYGNRAAYHMQCVEAVLCAVTQHFSCAAHGMQHRHFRHMLSASAKAVNTSAPAAHLATSTAGVRVLHARGSITHGVETVITPAACLPANWAPSGLTRDGKTALAAAAVSSRCRRSNKLLKPGAGSCGHLTHDIAR